MPRHPTVPLFDDVMGHPVPTLQSGAEEQRDVYAAQADDDFAEFFGTRGEEDGPR